METAVLIVLAALAAAGWIWHAMRAQPKATSVQADQLAKARIALLEHSANAEYHSAMAAMLHERVARLEGVE